MGKLTARQCTALLPGKHNDGDGLWLAVSKTGARKWFLRITINGKRREMGLGPFSVRPPGVNLAAARKKATEARLEAQKGIDPIEARHKIESTFPSFTTAAARYIRAQRHGWSNPKHAHQWVSTLKTYARPFIGSKPVDSINTEDILEILTPIWTTRTETAKRVQGRMENILDFAAAREWRDPLNPARWRGHLDKLLPRPTKVKTVRHQPAMPYTDLPDFMEKLRQNDSTSSKALQFLILTATRTSEVLLAQWSEFDLKAAIWTIPPERMKARREHRVPLCESAITILESLPRVSGNLYVFPGARYERPLSNMSLLQLMRGMGFGPNGNVGNFVPHGFRSSFRDWSGEVSSFPRDVCEMALAHVISNKAEAAYRRGDLFAKRRAMMDQWSEWCASSTTGKVSLLQTELQNNSRH